MVSLIPRKQGFFELFEQMTSTIAEAARYLETLVSDFNDLEVRLIRLKELEHEGDMTTHQSIARLNRTFLTPFDREDLHALATELDEILDWIEESGQRLLMYQCTTPKDDARRLARLAVRTTEELHHAMQQLKSHHRQKAKMEQHLVEVNRLENEADNIYRQALAELFAENGDNAIEILRWKEVYDALENVIDSCETVAHVIDSILVKHA